MHNVLETASTIVLGIIGLGIVALILSRNSNTSGVVQSLASGLGNTMGVAESPVTGSQYAIDLGYPTSIGGGFGA
jgi:hypothetical protein